MSPARREEEKRTLATRLRDWWRRHRFPQTTFVWCINGHEMVANGSWTHTGPDGEEIFTCKVCGDVSRWDFDPPVPLRLPS